MKNMIVLKYFNKAAKENLYILVICIALVFIHESFSSAHLNGTASLTQFVCLPEVMLTHDCCQSFGFNHSTETCMHVKLESLHTLVLLRDMLSAFSLVHPSKLYFRSIPSLKYNTSFTL